MQHGGMDLCNSTCSSGKRVRRQRAMPEQYGETETQSGNGSRADFGVVVQPPADSKLLVFLRAQFL